MDSGPASNLISYILKNKLQDPQDNLIFLKPLSTPSVENIFSKSHFLLHKV